MKLTSTKRASCPSSFQDVKTSRVLMLGWANREALESTRRHRSRRLLLALPEDRSGGKGESSGNHQVVVGMQLATDGQSVIYRVDPQGGVASHTGHASCYWRELVPGGWRECEPGRARARGHVRKMTSSRVEILEFVKMRGNPPLASKPIPK